MKTSNYIAMLLTLCVMAIPGLASGNKHEVTFEDDGNAPLESQFDVVFIAAGCAKVKSCGNHSVGTVCAQRTNVKPGDTVSYGYADGTSGRKSIICSKSSDGGLDSSARKTSTKHAHVCANDDGSWSTWDDSHCTNKVGSSYEASDDDGGGGAEM